MVVIYIHLTPALQSKKKKKKYNSQETYGKSKYLELNNFVMKFLEWNRFISLLHFTIIIFKNRCWKKKWLLKY